MQNNRKRKLRPILERIAAGKTSSRNVYKLMLREFDGLSYDDIADVLGCPVGTVRSRIFRAREAIDQRVKGQISGGSGFR